MRLILILTSVVACLVALATPARAVDGVQEINQTCAVETGCFPGDSPGFPVTIDGSAGRSYRLTSDLSLVRIDNALNTDAIVVNTDNVGIDLNNFAIISSNTCTGIPPVQPLICTSGVGGLGSGIEVGTSIPGTGISVKNGSIRGMGQYGILLGDGAEVSGVRVTWSGQSGIFVGSGSVVSGNTAYLNRRDGIRAVAGSTVSGNSAFRNGNNGISATDGSTIQRNTVRENGRYGLDLESIASYRENTITDNGVGTVDGGVNLGDNLCHEPGAPGATMCP